MKAADTCSVGGCPRRRIKRGWCGMHYQRWQIRGTTDLPIRTLPDRFWSKVAVGTGDDCWEWQASLRSDGYGQFDRGRSAHRVAYELAVGAIPDGLQIDHLCRNKVCVNPAHLEAVTPRENTLRSLPYRAKPTRRPDDLDHYRCPQGHPPSRVGIRRDGYPKCLDCMVEYQKNYQRRRAGSDA